MTSTPHDAGSRDAGHTPARAGHSPIRHGLDVHDVSWSVKGTVIVDGIELTAPATKITGLLGPNGSGKTTLLRAVARLAAPDRGVVHLDGVDLARLRRRDLAQRLAVVEQHAGTDHDVTVLDVVLLGRTPYRSALQGDSSDDRALARQALAQVDMLDFAERRWSTLSGGEKQRVHLARAFTQQPALLVLDEPTNHLDIAHALSLMSLVRRSGLTTFAALHDLNLAATFCDHLVVLDRGRVRASGTPHEVLTPQLLRDVYEVDADVGVHPRTGRPLLTFHPPDEVLPDTAEPWIPGASATPETVARGRS
ncbi:ABC transporter ATP-binding protein [Actinobacteria bacterium YIM 96077]|uniref:Histidinol phosphatase n=1 Tax=Phytoactinopolyspora halophila TaxID=1981511 RepID=A0A329QP82_9ACTN|nr:ABC transporter ATP-binding protein [Phytoactinopolyspora halophila]AYY15060.1 ABC transporter ATP-binding protein [Actinobacteria bacterium YIM 96077]RAW14175.1 histidinol phosphatase [Phytoactinopolyspora halophila]